MASMAKLKEEFGLESKYGAFYTGGTVEWLEDSLYCQTESCINILDVETGQVVKKIGEKEDAQEEIDSMQTFTTDGIHFVSSHKSGLLKLWNENGELEKIWKYIHKGPIAKLTLFGSQLASGGSDSIVRLWNLKYQACYLALKGCTGVVNVVEYCLKKKLLFASADDGKINAYDLVKGQLKTTYEAHFSKVTSIVFANDDEHFVSCGRDKVIVLWNFNNNRPLKTIAVYEAIEAIVGLPVKFKVPGFKAAENGIYVASAGEDGVIRVWDLKNTKEVFIQTNSMVSKAAESGGLSITHLLYNRKSTNIAVVTVDHNIVIHSLKSFVCLKQFIGFSDEILDIALLGQDDTYIAVASNSNDIKLYNYTSMSCQLLKGHTDLVLSLSVSHSDRDLMVSAGKDNSVRMWRLEGGQVSCIGVGKRHTGSVGCVSFFYATRSFFVSASEDTCLKLWETPPLEEAAKKKREKIKLNEYAAINCRQTVVAHQKEINCVTVSPNDKLVASASQDKTVKLWTCDQLEFKGILKGHKRGVWSVRFSPVDQVVASSSADCTIKLWSVVNYSCLKTFEGHESSVLRADFLSNGVQILSAGSDGLIKIFNIKNSECQCTMDQHNGRIWALAIKKDESGFISGGSDSYLIKWKDMTEENKMVRQKELEEQTLQEQELSNYLQSDQLLKALKLALKLDRPFQTLKIIQDIIKKGETGLTDTIKSLRNDQKESLMNCALTWNTNSKNCHSAQLIINILLHELQSGVFRPVGLNKITEGVLPYTERHFNRVNQLMLDINLITYMLDCMQPHARNVNINS